MNETKIVFRLLFHKIIPIPIHTKSWDVYHPNPKRSFTNETKLAILIWETLLHENKKNYQENNTSSEDWTLDVCGFSLMLSFLNLIGIYLKVWDSLKVTFCCSFLFSLRKAFDANTANIVCLRKPEIWDNHVLGLPPCALHNVVGPWYQ